MSKQTSLGAFGFTKIVTKKDGKAKLVDISNVVCEEKPLTFAEEDLEMLVLYPPISNVNTVW